MHHIWDDIREFLKLQGADMRDNSARRAQRQPRGHHVLKLVRGKVPQPIQTPAYSYIATIRSGVIAQGRAIHA